MSKRLRTSKGTTAESEHIEGVTLPASPATTVGVATRLRHTTASATTALVTGKSKGGATTSSTMVAAGDSAAATNKHVMLPAFLSKTYEIFSMPEFATICGWNASGDTIIVSQLEAFVAMVLPRFFKHRNFPSFVRQLNLYGFHKTVLDSKRLEFQHPYFKRDRPDLLHYIKRKVSTGTPATQQPAASRLEVHREVSDQLLKEMKELRQRSDTMEKRLRELEVDNAIVRSDNMKLWKHLESAKDKQMVMQEKMKKIMWILFQIYRGQGLPKLGGHNQDEVISEDSRLGPKEFHDVLRYLAMDEPPLLPRSSTAAPDSTALNGRKRKFVEFPAVADTFDDELVGSSSVVEIGSPVRESQPARGVPATATLQDLAPSNVLSVFSPQPQFTVPRIAAQEVQQPTTIVVPPATAQVVTNAIADVANLPDLPEPTTTALTTTTTSVPAVDDASASLDLIDDDLPLLNESDGYAFNDAEEQHVMKKLEDFESSLLDEYDVGCLDTLLQQLKAGHLGKAASILPALDSDEIGASSDEGAQTSA